MEGGWKQEYPEKHHLIFLKQNLSFSRDSCEARTHSGVKPNESALLTTWQQRLALWSFGHFECNRFKVKIHKHLAWVYHYLQWCALSGFMLIHLGHLKTTWPSFNPSFIIFSLVAFPLGTAPWNYIINKLFNHMVSLLVSCIMLLAQSIMTHPWQCSVFYWNSQTFKAMKLCLNEPCDTLTLMDIIIWIYETHQRIIHKFYMK